MKMIEIEPVDILKPYVKKLVIYSIDISQTYKVLPDSSLVIGFQYSGSISLIEHNNTVIFSLFHSMSYLIRVFRWMLF